MNSNNEYDPYLFNYYYERVRDKLAPDFFDTSDTDLITAADIVFSAAHCHINGVAISEIELRNLDMFFMSFHTMIHSSDCSIANDQNKKEYCIGFVHDLEGLYRQLLFLGVITTPFESQEVICERFKEGILRFKKQISELPDEEIKKYFHPIVFKGQVILDGGENIGIEVYRSPLVQYYIANISTCRDRRSSGNTSTEALKKLLMQEILPQARTQNSDENRNSNHTSNQESIDNSVEKRGVVE